MFINKNYIGVNIPKCWICNKLTAVLTTIMAGRTFVKVCNECVKYGTKVELSEIDSTIDHCGLIEVINIKPKK